MAEREALTAEPCIGKRTVISQGAKDILKGYYEKGMNHVGSPLISEASTKLLLSKNIIENWIGNYRRTLHSTQSSYSQKPKLLVRELSGYNLFCRNMMKKTRGEIKDLSAWSRLPAEEKALYNEEAAALKAERSAEALSPEMRELKISRHLNQIKKEVTMLETLGVEVVTLAFNRFSMDPNVKVQHIASRKAEAFLNDASIRAFGIFLADTSSAATAGSSTEKEKKDLMKKVQELFNMKYNEAGGTGKLPYKKAIVQATGLPQGMTLRKPNFYGKDQLKAILENAHQISLQIRKELDPEGLSPSPGRPQTSLPVIPVLHTSGQLAGALSSQSLTQGPESQSPQSLTQVKKKKKGGSRKRKAVVELSQVEDDAIVNDPTKIFMAMMEDGSGPSSRQPPDDENNNSDDGTEDGSQQHADDTKEAVGGVPFEPCTCDTFEGL
ncbi:uncharacterized protein LOC133440801 [Cololabis saira]|uniref:uncharacterized protein LOC133440801 n=1 Tax=Cololabis saira TaxID=129043 RepID=UPI002AD273F1|nr:uncharacterized protein LOC133440801 [Cololabis saira]